MFNKNTKLCFLKMKIYVINLKRNPERLDLFFRSLPDCWKKTDITVVEAVDGKEADIPEWFHITKNLVGRYGCYKSHLNIIESIKDTSLILEDDVLFEENFKQKWDSIMHTSQNFFYDVFYLGGKHLSKPRNTRYGPYIKKCKATILTHAYIVNKQSVKKISRLLKNKYTWQNYLPLKNYEIDLLYSRLQQEDILSAYAVDPFLIKQHSIFKSTTKN